MTASGRAVPVDAQHLNEVRTLLETCEAQASTLSWTGGDDSAVPEQALQMPIGKHLACPTADGHPPHQAGEHSTDGIGLACKSSAIDDQRHNTAPAAMSQEGKPLGKFMTAGGRAVAVDTGHLKEAQALLEQCEVQANILPCIDADDLPILEPATSQLPSDKHCVCQGRDLLEILNPPHDPNQQGNPLGKLMTAGGRAVAVDTGRLKEAQALFEPCEVQASSLPWTGSEDSAVPEPAALQMPCGKHSACPTTGGLLEMLNPPHQVGRNGTDGIGLACNTSAVDDQRHSGAPAAMSQEGKPLGKFMTAGGRAVAVDTGRLKEAQALLEPCEVQASSLPWTGSEDSAVPEPAALQMPCGKHSACPTTGGLLELLNPPHQVGRNGTDGIGLACNTSNVDDQRHSGAPAAMSQEGKPLGKFMTAGGRAVAVDTGRLKEAQALLEPCEVQASSLPWTGSEDSAVPESAALHMPHGKHSACPTTGGLLDMLNPPHQVGRNSTDGIGLACNTSAVDDQRHSGAPAAMSQEGEPLGKFMTAGGRAVAVDTGRLKEAQALLVPCEVQASSLPWTGSEDSAVPEPAALHMPHGKHSACPTTGGLLEMLNPPHQVGRNSTDGIGLACNTSAVDDQRHSAAPAAMSQEGKPLGKFMMAGGRAVAVDTGRLMEAQALFEPCEVQASSLPWTGSEDSAVPEPYTASGKALQGWAIEEEQAVAKVQEVSTCTGSLERAQTPLGSQSAGGVSPSKPAPCGIEKLESPCPDRHRKRPCILSNSPLLQLAGGLDDPCGNAGVPCFGQRHFSGDMLGSTWREDLELTQPTIDVSLLDWISEEDPPGIAQGFAIPQVCTENSARYDNRWLRTQLAQLCLLSARATRIISSNSESISERLAKRARAEISGRRSAIFQICAGLAPADQHMVLLCTAPRYAQKLHLLVAGWGRSHAIVLLRAQAAVSEMCHAGPMDEMRVSAVVLQASRQPCSHYSGWLSQVPESTGASPTHKKMPGSS